MTTKTYTGHIINGRITGIGQQLSNDIKDIESQEILLTIEPVRRTKTLQQLRAFHGTVLDQVQQCHMEMDGEYMSKDKIKFQLKERHLDKKLLYWSDGTPVMNKVEHPEKPGVYFQYHVKTVPSLADLTKEQMMRFIEAIISEYWHNYQFSIVLNEKVIAKAD